jgi:beta-barrel assembly-enhancing protease
LSSRSVVREIAVVLAVCAVLGAAAFAAQRLFVPRQPSTSGIAANLDESLGSLVLEQVRATQKVIEVPAAAKDLDLIVSRLHDALPEPRPAFTVILIQSPEINAFTIPGDTVCVDTGLIRALASADEMAGVLGHEMSHAVNRDPLTMLGRRLGMAALVAAVSGGRGGAVLSNLGQTFVDMRYGREAEDRADAFSVGLLGRAGIRPGAFAEALQRIRDSAPKEPALLKYIDPHSPIGERIDRARALALQQKVTARPLGIDWEALIKALPGR